MYIKETHCSSCMPELKKQQNLLAEFWRLITHDPPWDRSQVELFLLLHRLINNPRWDRSQMSENHSYRFAARPGARQQGYV
jgi:hypothetical protein